MRVSTSMSQVMVLCQKRVNAAYRFMREDKMGCEMDRLIGGASVVMRALNWEIAVKSELEHKAKLDFPVCSMS